MKFWVQNRAETVRETVVVENWGFGFSSLNPADICTRECSVGKSKVVVVDRSRTFVWRKRDVAIIRVLVAKKCKFREKKKREDWF